MLVPDTINGCFEAAGALFMCHNIRTIYKDKMVKGVSKLTMIFFASWGYWNCYYYPHLDQWFSFCAGVCLALSNSIWVCQMLYYNYWNKKPMAFRPWYQMPQERWHKRLLKRIMAG